MNPPITATYTLDGILQELKAIIAHSEPEQLKDITSHVQGILPAEGAEVSLRAGSNDEDKRATISFCVSKTATSTATIPMLDLIQSLLFKTPLDDLEHLGNVLNHLKQFDGKSMEWGASKPEYIEGVGHVCYFFIHSQ